jgi:hypothetical protein
MPSRTGEARTPWLNNLLVILAFVGVFAAFDIVGHKYAYFWAKLVCVVAFSVGCLLLTRDRGALDTLSAVIAALFTLCAIAMTTGDRVHPNWWPFFLGFAGAAVSFVFLTRKKRETLVAVAAIVGFRLIVFVVLYVAHS